MEIKTDRISSSQKHRQVKLGLSVVSRRRAISFWVWSMPNMTFTSIRSSHFALVVYTSFEEYTTSSLTHTCFNRSRLCCRSTPPARLDPRSLCQTTCRSWSPRRRPCRPTPSQRPRLSSPTRPPDLLFKQLPLYIDQPFSCAVCKTLKEILKP